MNFMESIIELPSDYEGRVVATLIEAQSHSKSSKAILYIHGYIDYFFQTHIAERFTQEGFNFYALDLRKYGRSILDNQHPNYCRNLREYYPEIDITLDKIQEVGNDYIALVGHSTGGLLASLYCADGANRLYINTLILNSPFFEFNTTWVKRKIAIPLSGLVSYVLPYAHKRNELSPYYCSSVHASMNGEWEFDLRYKPQNGIPLYFAWLNAICKGQNKLKRGLGITIPILVMHSSESSMDNEWSDKYTHTDTVLNICDIEHYAHKLGDNITIVEIDGGLHDLTLSRREIREKVLDIMVKFSE